MDYNVNFYVIFEYNKLNTNRVIRNDGFYFKFLGEENQYKKKWYLTLATVFAAPLLALIGVDINSFSKWWYRLSLTGVILLIIASLVSIYLFYYHNKKELNEQWNEIISDIKNILSIPEKIKEILKGIFKIVGFLGFIFLLLFFILLLPKHQNMEKYYIEKIKIKEKYDSLVKVCSKKEVDSTVFDNNNIFIDSNQMKQVDSSETNSNIKRTKSESDNNSLKEKIIEAEKDKKPKKKLSPAEEKELKDKEIIFDNVKMR